MTFKLKPDQEQKIEDLISQMTLEEKIGQMSQVRHFDDVTPEEIKSKFIGSVIHTQGPVPGSTAAEWQDKFSEFQKQALDFLQCLIGLKERLSPFHMVGKVAELLNQGGALNDFFLDRTQGSQKRGHIQRQAPITFKQTTGPTPPLPLLHL